MRWCVIFIALFIASPLNALEPGEALEDPAMELRARVLMSELRCMVCQNETIEASPSPFAGEVRLLVREQIVAGRSDGEVKAFLSARYGDAILFRPPMGPATWALWLAPFILLGLGGIITVIVIRSARASADANSEAKSVVSAELSAKEKKQLESILRQDDKRRN